MGLRKAKGGRRYRRKKYGVGLGSWPDVLSVSYWRIVISSAAIWASLPLGNP